MKEIKHHSALLFASLAILAAVALFVMPGIRQRTRGQQSVFSMFPILGVAQASEINPWKAAIEKIKQDRGEPTGKQAKVDIPSEVKHYSDTRRFLAIQVAESREHSLRTPTDLVDLADMVKRGEMVTLQPVTDNYILFGVGGNADKNPFTRYGQGKSVAIFNEAGLQLEYQRISEFVANTETSVAGFKTELASLSKRDRSRRAQLNSQISEAEKSLRAVRDKKVELDRNYGKAETRQQFFTDYALVETVAKSFPDRDFDVAEPSTRLDLKVRLLSSLRPEALKVMNEIASAYRQKFDRPLPITSLVRPDEYQHALSKTNPNATKIETPPHSTGLAFDIYYRFMTAAEQKHVMDHLAKLKNDGRIEVLRENRDHYHVFAFVDGVRPSEDFINEVLGKAAPAPVAKQSAPAARTQKAVLKKPATKRIQKNRRRK